MNRVLVIAYAILIAVSVLPLLFGEALAAPIHHSAIVLTAIYVGFMAKRIRNTPLLQSGLYALTIPIGLIFLRLVVATFADLAGSADLFSNLGYFVLGMLMLSPFVYGLGLIGHVISRMVDVARSKRDARQ